MLVQGGGQALLPEHGLEGLGLAPVGGEDHHGKALFLVLGQVLGQGLKADAVPRQLPGGEGEEIGRGHRKPPGEKGVQVQQGPLGQAGTEGLETLGEHRGLAGEHPLLQQGGDVLPQLPEVVLGPLGHPGGVAEADQGVLGKVIGGGGQGVVHRGQGQIRGVGEGLPRRGQHLPGGEEGDGLPLGGAPLGDGVEETQGVDLIPPELQAHGEVQAGGEHVQDAPPQGELAHPLHLVAPGVPRLDQEVGDLLQPAGLAGGELPAVAGKDVRGQGALEQPLDGGHQDGAVPPGQPGQDLQPLVLPLAGGCPRVKQKVPGGKEGDLPPGEGGQVPGHAPGLPVVGAHQHQGAAGGLAEPRGHIGPVDGGQPRQGQGALPLCQGLGQGGEVPQPGEKAGETGGSNGHRTASFPGRRRKPRHGRVPPPRLWWGGMGGRGAPGVGVGTPFRLDGAQVQTCRVGPGPAGVGRWSRQDRRRL